VHQVGHLPRNP